MNPQIKAEDLAPVAEFLNEECDGSFLKVSRHLCHSIYMFQFLPDDDPISAEARSNTAAILWKLKEAMMDCWFAQMKKANGGKGWQFVKMD